MGRNKTTLRRIHVLNEDYLWKREHFHLENPVTSKCAEKVTIYMEGRRGSFLKLIFKEDDNKPEGETWIVGYPDTGVVWNRNKAINLNRPAVIAAIIHYFRYNHWAPGTATKPTVVEDALKILDFVDLPVGYE
ncbi:MAG: hypothetical protein K0S32_4507 [Bacteroidetes bacterium]|jgi:hypothetical protein|nr:hypothetical protein [Bacteroidota bacterium]